MDEAPADTRWVQLIGAAGRGSHTESYTDAILVLDAEIRFYSGGRTVTSASTQ